jgi:hypothetical protein
MYSVSFLEWQIGEVLEKIKIQAEIKSVALTLYLNESNLVCFSSIFLIYLILFNIDQSSCST